MTLEPTLRAYLAGSVCIERGDILIGESRLPGPQGRLAFAVLLAGRAQPISRDALAEAIWDGSPPPAWDTALRAVISKLRTLLADAGVEGDPIPSAFGCYQLRLPTGSWVDIEAADDAAHRAEAALAASDLDDALGWALVAVAVSARPFLPGEEGAFVEGWRERLRTIRVRALEVRAAILLDREQFPLAARDAETILLISPFRETAVQLLMRAHAGAGNPAEALRAYERTRRLIADELGVDPSPATQALFAELLAAR